MPATDDRRADRPTDRSGDAPADRSTLVTTREALHRVAERVLSPAYFAATGHIGLRAAPGGIATPPFPSDAGPRQVALDGTDLVVRDDRGERRRPLSTIADAAELAGVDLDRPIDVYQPTTSADPDEALEVHPADAARLADWIALSDAALERLRADRADRGPSVVQLWPEHFDLSTTIDRVNFGGSPGDAHHALPYLYVGPFAPVPPDGGFWNEEFGASRSADEIDDAADALAFFLEGARRLES